MAVGSITSDAVSPHLRGATLTLAGHDHQASALGARANAQGYELDSSGTAEALVRTVAPVPARADVARLAAAGITTDPSIEAGRWSLLGGTEGGLAQLRTLESLGVSIPRTWPSWTPRPSARTVAAASVARRRGRRGRRSAGAAPRDGRRGRAAARVVVTGGWRHSAEVMRAKAARFGPVEVSAVEEAGSLGAATFAAPCGRGDRRERPPRCPVTRTWFADERHAEILRRLGADRRVESAGLAALFGISAERVRKDLALLEARRLLRRVHGGAVPREPSRAEPHVADRGDRLAEKSAIARRALDFVPEGGSLLLDAGRRPCGWPRCWPSTAILSSIPIPGPSLPPCRSAIRSCCSAADPSGDVAAVGALRPRPGVGQRGDFAFLGTNGLTLDRGLTTPDADEADVKRLMLAAAKQRVFLVHSSKFGQASLARHAALSNVDVLITDDGVTRDQRDGLRAAGITVEVVAS